MDEESFCNLEHHVQEVLGHTSNSDNVYFVYHDSVFINDTIECTFDT